jgi:hypothetical protein
VVDVAKEHLEQLGFGAMAIFGAAFTVLRNK